MIYRSGRDTPLVLIVDDDDFQRFLYRESLEVSGFDIVEASDGSEAIETFLALRPDLIILDVMMPGMDGYDTCRTIRSHPAGATVPILMATGLDDLEAIDLSYQVGATDYVSKPINPALLPHRVRYVLRSDQSMNNLRASEAQLAEAQRIAELGNFAWRPSERSVRWSAQAARIFGEDEGTAITAVWSMLRRIPRADRQSLIRAFRELNGETVIKLDHQIIMPDGALKHVCLRAELVRDERGELLVRGTYQDISQRKQSELALRVARDAAEAANDAKTAFLAAMSHEFRTPLNAIIGFAEIIAQQSFGPVPAKYIDFAGNILTAGQRILVSVADVLTMAQLEAGSFALRPELLELREVTKTVLAAFRRHNPTLDRELRFDPPPTSMPIIADERGIAEMITKLLSNAVKFSGAGSPITIRLDHAPSGECRLSIADEGIGMSPEQVEIAVQPFSQVDNGMAREFEGIGLGLSITKGLIEAHGGVMKITSAPMTGTEVELLFPVRDRDRQMAGQSLAA